MKHVSFRFTFSLLLLFFLTGRGPLRAERLDSILRVLDHTIARKADYEQAFIRKVDSLRKSAMMQTSPQEALRLTMNIAAMETQHSSTAALNAYREAQRQATELGDEETAALCSIRIAMIYGQIYQPTEGLEILRKIGEPSRFSVRTRRTYYDVMHDLYDFYRSGDILSELCRPRLKEAEQYMDSINKYLRTPEQQARIFQYSTPNVQEMVNTMRQAFFKEPEGGKKALLAVVLSNKYHLLRDNDARDYWWAVSAIYSLRYVCYEYEALLRLAGRMYDRGDTNRGAHYAKAAFEMADTWGSPARKIELSKTLNRGLAIDHEAAHSLNRERDAWRIVAVTALAMMGAAGFLLLRNRKKAGTAVAALQNSGEEAERRISSLQSEVEDKTEYIARSLSLSLDALFYIEQTRMTVLARLKAGETDRLRKQLSAGDLTDKFREECLKRFDLSFFHLHPDFTRRVNRLFRNDAQMVLSDTEILNNELRVLAFAKMGITDATRIASILGVSVQTVYWYRNHLKNRAANRESFDRDIDAI